MAHKKRMVEIAAASAAAIALVFSGPDFNDGWQRTVSAQTTAEPVNFPAKLSPVLPLDVDLDALKKLSFPRQIPEGQRLFDIFAWQNFIAMNWPSDANGPLAGRTMADNSSPRAWEFYREAFTVFLPAADLAKGQKPAPWNPSALNTGARSLVQPMKIHNANHPSRQVLDESLQAFTGPLVDQNGKWFSMRSSSTKPSSTTW